MADFKRPAEGFRYRNAGLKTNSTPDSIPVTKYNVLQNVRSYSDSSIRTRPGMTQVFHTNGAAVTDLRAYSTLGSDDKPRFLARGASDLIWLDNSVQVGTMASGSTFALGASMIAFRPNQSPTPYMYVATASDYQKFSAPTGSNAVVQQNVGIVEPPSPPAAGISKFNTSFIGLPAGGAQTPGGTNTGITIGNRVTDTVQGVFPDPVGLGMTTIQVAGGAGLASGVYLSGSVTAYFWPRLSYEQGAFLRNFPLATSSASATATGTSLMFNPPEFNGTTDPAVQPIEWANVSPAGAITGYQVPWSGATQGYDMVVMATLFVPAPGNYTITVNNDDGMIFAIQGATFVSGPRDDHFGNHTQTAGGGYAFTGGIVGGVNTSGFHSGQSYVINFPTSGAYQLEIDYAQWFNEQTLDFRNNGAIFKQASGISSYQRGMVLVIAGQLLSVEDVFTPLPQTMAINKIAYLSGTTGQCVVVPASLGSGPGIDSASINEIAALASLRRGALVQIGSETCFVLDVETGPDGTVCFTTSTVDTHTSSDTLKGVPAISVFHPAVAVGNAITSLDVEFGMTTGLGWVTSPNPLNPFALAQPDDLIHLSFKVDNLSNLIEAKLLFDVGDGSFTENFYFKAIRPNDIALGVSNGLTQLGVAQLVAQRAVIDEEKAAEAGNQGPTSSSDQTTTGVSQWGEIEFSINELTRVGNDQTKTLQTLNAIQLLVNASGTLSVAFNSITVKGGYGPDVGPSGAPYLYRFRPRSSVTGAKGNPSPAIRYGTNPRRQQVTIPLPRPNDVQTDTYDIFRYGGTVTSWRKIGSTIVPEPFSGSIFFVDNYADATALAGEELEFDNYQPWPSIDVPLITSASVVCGTMALVNVPAPTKVLNYLPGNLVTIGGSNVYTLYTRPTLVSGTTYLFRFVENAGAPSTGGGGAVISIYEPAVAQQRLPYMWGPDAEGTIFAVGDPLRLGTVYECKANQPDSAPDTYNQEIVPPSEPLMGGEIMDGVSYVASTERWWRMYFQSGSVDRYKVIQQPIPRGLAAPLGHCTDGQSISFWAKDGIWDTSAGSLTDDDLYNLFPHEGVLGQSVTYNGITFTPPDYSRTGTFRLDTGNGYIYATYQDSSGFYHCLVYDRKHKSWSVDVYNPSITLAYHPEQQSGTVLTNTASYQKLLFGTSNGLVTQQTDLTNDLTTPISCAVATAEWDGGDVRAGEQWGDLWLDSNPVSAITATPMAFGTPVDTPSTVGPQASRLQTPISLGGETLSDFLGLMTTWTDDFTSQTTPTTIHIWQPSFLPKPETIIDRFTDWYSAGNGDTAGGAAWWQGFILHADTSNVIKSFVVRDADTGTTHPFTPVVRHNGEQTLAYSFNTPFIAHLVRIEPTDTVPWRFFDVEWISEPTPEAAETWQTQGTSFGFNGYSHIQRIVGAYAASSPVTLTITSFDGQSPQPITLPSTGGSYEKILQVLTANKGQLYFFKATSATPFQLYLDDFEVKIGNWGRVNEYLTYKSLGGRVGAEAKV